MPGTTSCLSPRDSDKMDFEELVEVFGSSISLEDIESAYVHANRDANAAANILSRRGSALDSSGNSTVTSSKFSPKSDHLSGLPPVSLSNDIPQKPYFEKTHTGAPNSYRSSVSMGSISRVIGNGYSQPQKSVKLDSDEWLVSGIRNEKGGSYMKPGNTNKGDNLQEFLFKMLRDGFQLEQEQIREVLGHCGYDMQTGMDHLFELSASTLKKSDDIVDISGEMSAGKNVGLENLSSLKLHEQDSVPSNGATGKTTNLRDSQKKKKDKDLEKEILNSLFTVPERVEQAPKRMLPRRNTNRFNLVDKPFSDTLDEECSHVTVTDVPQDAKEGDNGDSYDRLRQAVKEYWVTMKEYYKAAVDEFAKGEHARADKLLDEGRRFYERAREADDKSAEKLFNTRNSHTIALDMCFHDTKGALRLLETHLTNLSGIPDMNLKIILGTGEDIKKEARKRLKVLKLLEEASIGWTEDKNGQVLWIPMEKINPRTLSFSKRG